ncbi:MAG: hypothetical protein LBD99_02435 [Candidatus Margulisbacteria bacterium]|nr:hypothetical protein [Candidatus Margulisiibacteriota bacterium]
MIDSEKTAALLSRLTAAATEEALFTEIIALSGCYYDRLGGSASFGVWSPRLAAGQKLILNIAVPADAPGAYTLFKYDMPRLDSALKAGRDFFLLALKNIEPFSAPGQGALYFYTFPEQPLVPDIYAFYQPFGVDGPSAVIDQDYLWRSEKSGGSTPISITKLHVGIASPSGDFAGLQKEIMENKYFAAVDSLEFLPLGAFPGRCGWRLELNENQLLAVKTSEQKPINWGYDGGPAFILSVSEAYGLPGQLKALVDTARMRGIKIGFDIQLNHFGPEGVYQNYYFPEYISPEQTEWGARPNFRNNYVRRLLLGKLKEFCLLYRPDYLRLDMSSRYGDDDFIAEICHLLPDLPVILEDERQKKWLTDSDGAGALACWSFPAVHDLQKIRAGNFAVLPELLAKITSAERRVIFANSHDEQGNNDARPVLDKLTPALAALANGIEMSWYAFGWFHFFCNYRDDVQLVLVTAEKSGAIRHYPAELWPRMTALHPYFQDFQTAQEFYNFIHHLWRAEVAPCRGDPAQCRRNVQVWISNNEMLAVLCLAFNQMVFALANIASWTADPAYLEFIGALKKLRKENLWLYRACCYYHIDHEQKKLAVLSINEQTKQAVKLTYSLGDDTSVKLSVL